MRGKILRTVLLAIGVVSCVAYVFTLGPALAQSTNWIDELSNSLTFYKTNYPNSNWEPFEQRLSATREAVGRNDQRAVRLEMNKFFKMLTGRAHGINEIAADELYNFAMMVTPVQEYGISVPAVPTGGGVGN
jgi:hypothetical protein